MYWSSVVKPSKVQLGDHSVSLSGGAASGDHLHSPQRMQRMHEPQDYLCSPRGPSNSRDILEDSEIPRNESIVTSRV